MREKIMLWNTVAPYSDDSPMQEQPSITDYSVKGSKGAVVVVPGGGYHNLVIPTRITEVDNGTLLGEPL